MRSVDVTDAKCADLLQRSQLIESMLGEEIVDEVDSAVDMQDVAQRRKRERNQAESASDDDDTKKRADA